MRPTEEEEFDLPVPEEIDPQDDTSKEALIRADQDARELRVDPNTRDPSLPDMERVKQQLESSTGRTTAFAARDPRIRVEMVTHEGGTTLTEAAVARALRWLAAQQNKDGSWSLHKHGGIESDSAGTSLALMPFLGAGQNHLAEVRYRETVAKGLRWLIEHQRPDGDLRDGSTGNSGMYAHGQGAIVLCEAFAMTGDESLRLPAQKSIDFIVAAQHSKGGWRYRPGEAGDTSVLGWQVMALQSARVAGLSVPGETFSLADQYLDSVEDVQGSGDYRGAPLYGYMPNNRPTGPMTAEAVLCRLYLGWQNDEPGLDRTVNWLVEEHLPSDDSINMYFWYYATQVMHHWGGKEWSRWNGHMSTVLVNSQEKRGDLAGSWQPTGQHDQRGGRIYMTALAACTLEVYYRHLPIFRQIDLDAEGR